MKWLKLSLQCGFGLAALFGLFSLIFYFGDWSRFAFVAPLGFFSGLIAAPEIEPKVFIMPSLLQVTSGAIAGTIVGIMLNLSTVEIAMTSFAGGFLGWLAPYWIKHMPIP